MKKNLIMLSSLLALTTLVGCDNSPKTIKIIGSDIVYTGGEFRYYVKSDPSNANKDVTWTSSDPTIAEIDGTGKITNKIIKTGTFTITATSKKNSSIKDSLEVTAYAGEEMTQDEFIPAYKEANDKFADDMKKASGKGETIKFTCNEGDLMCDENVDSGEFKSPSEEKMTAEMYFKYKEKLISTTELIPNSIALDEMITDMQETKGADVGMYKVNESDLYYYYYFENEEGEVYELYGFDKNGYLIREIGYSTFDDSNVEPEITYLHLKVAS